MSESQRPVSDTESTQPRSTAGVYDAGEKASRSTVGVYDAPERRAGGIPMVVIVLVIALIVAAVVGFWLF